MAKKSPSPGYFRNSLPYNRSVHGPKPLLIFQGLMFENKPQPGMTFGVDLSDLVVTIEAEDQHAFKERLLEISAPTLVIAGVDDPFYSPALFREMAAGIPDARLVLYEKMRHPATGKQFERDVLAFLGETQ
jgi:pimeloyl-ACP methyl ester carboxylesterase